MYQSILAVGFVVLSLAAAWSVYKAVYFLTHDQGKEGVPYLVAFLILVFFDYYLMLLLPLG